MSDTNPVTPVPPTVPVGLLLSYNPKYTPQTAQILIAITNDDQDPPVVTGVDPTVAAVGPFSYTSDANGPRYTATATAVGTGTCVGTVTLDGAINAYLGFTVQNAAPETGVVTVVLGAPPAPPATA